MACTMVAMRAPDNVNSNDNKENDIAAAEEASDEVSENVSMIPSSYPPIGRRTSKTRSDSI